MEPPIRASFTDGAFFLLEDWALRWDAAISKAFGNKPEVVREIFQLSSRSLLCLRTPCSGNFELAAMDVSAKVGLPLRWMDVGLDNLETVLRQTLERRRSIAGNPLVIWERQFS